MDPFVVLGPGTLADRNEGDVVELPPATAKHLRTVLRRPEGSGVVLSDGAGTTVPAHLLAAGARCLAAPTTTPAPVPALHVLQGLAKGRRIDEVVRTLTELGVDAITPVAADRSVKELEGSKVERTLARWRAVATAAAEQSRRAHLPSVEEPGSLAEVLDRYDRPAGDTRIVAAHVGASLPLASALTDDLASADRVVVAVGPEGGWTQDELACFAEHGAAVVTLGDHVLRTEHAAAALAAVVAFVLGRMG